MSSNCFYRRITLSGSRKSITFLLLISFLNTILFPAICLPTHHYKKIDFGQSFTEYLVEDYMNIYDPTADNQEEDVNDLFNTIEDIDLIIHFSTTTISAICTHIGLTYIRSDSTIIHTFLSSSTPPPEHFM